MGAARAIPGGIGNPAEYGRAGVAQARLSATLVLKIDTFISCFPLILFFTFSPFVCTNSRRKTPMVHEMATRSKSEKIDDFEVMHGALCSAGYAGLRCALSDQIWPCAARYMYRIEFSPALRVHRDV